jgi:hypothetical protein
MPRVYITYRPNDTTADEVQQLVIQIGAAFGDENVQLTAADAPVDVLRLYDVAQSYDVLLVVIGQHWLDMQNEQGEHLIDDPFDYAYTEIFAALEKPDMWISSIVTDGAKMPDWEDLPEAINQLVRRDIVDLSNKQRLAQKIDELIRRMGVIDAHVPADTADTPSEPIPPKKHAPQPDDQTRASNETQKIFGCMSNFILVIFALSILIAILVVAAGYFSNVWETNNQTPNREARLTQRAPATLAAHTPSPIQRSDIFRITMPVRELDEVLATRTVGIVATQTYLAEMRTHAAETEAGYIVAVTEMAETRTARLDATRNAATSTTTPSRP